MAQIIKQKRATTYTSPQFGRTTNVGQYGDCGVDLVDPNNPEYWAKIAQEAAEKACECAETATDLVSKYEEQFELESLRWSNSLILHPPKYYNYEVTLQGDTTITVIPEKPLAPVMQLLLLVTQGTTGGHKLILGSGISTPSGDVVLSYDAGSRDAFLLNTFDGGRSWIISQYLTGQV